MKTHVLAGVPGRRFVDNSRFSRGVGMVADGRGGIKYLPPAEDGIDPETGLPYPDTVAVDDPGQDGVLIEQPSERAEEYDPNAALQYIAAAGAFQKATGEKVGGVDWISMGNYLSAGISQGGGNAGAVGAIIGAIVALAVWGIDMHYGILEAGEDARYGDVNVRSWSKRYVAPQLREFVAIKYGRMGTIRDFVALLAAELVDAPASPDVVADGRFITRPNGTRLYWERDGLRVLAAVPPAQRVFVDTDRFLWRNMDGVAVRSFDLVDSAGGFDGAAALYEPLAVDYAMTRLEANPAGSESAATPGVISTGTGGIYMRKGAIGVYEPGAGGPGGGSVAHPDGNNTFALVALIGAAVALTSK